MMKNFYIPLCLITASALSACQNTQVNHTVQFRSDQVACQFKATVLADAYANSVTTTEGQHYMLILIDAKMTEAKPINSNSAAFCTQIQQQQLKIGLDLSQDASPIMRVQQQQKLIGIVEQEAHQVSTGIYHYSQVKRVD